MTHISSVGLGIPSYEIEQFEVKELVKSLFPYSKMRMKRLLPVFDNANVKKRQLVVEKEWFLEEHTFEEKNRLYMEYAQKQSLKAIDHCLNNQVHLTSAIPYEAIDLIVYVSSTGIATPSIDAHLINERPFRQDIARMPLWGLGCAGGAIGISRIHDWISANPTKTALLVCCELCSLTFQKGDTRKSNLIGTALFGDGASALLAVGQQSPYLNHSRRIHPKIKETHSHIERNSTDVMGWEVSNKGLEVIFSKSIPALVESMWKEHACSFLEKLDLTVKEIYSFIAHPGGRKVLEAMVRSLDTSSEKFIHSYNILAKHGNMSSATVLYILNEWMKEQVPRHSQSVLSALGPGFSSELLLLEWT